MQRKMQKRMKMRGGGEITQRILDALTAAGITATNLADKLTEIAKPDASSSVVGGTKKRKLKTRRRKTMKPKH